MTHDDSLRERYADLLGHDPDDPALARLLTALDTRYAAEPPAGLAAALDRAIRDRTRPPADAPRPHPTTPARTGRNTTVVHHQEGAAPMPARRLPVILGGLAAVLVVGLMATLLISLGGRGATGLGGNGETPQQRFARLGGLEFVLRVACPAADTSCDLNQRLPDFQSAVTRRAAGLNASEVAVRVALVKATYADVVVDLPGFTDKPKALLLLGRSGELDFIDTGAVQLSVGDDVTAQLCGSNCAPSQYHIVLSGAQLDTNAVSAELDVNTNRPIVMFAFKGDAKQQFAQYTGAHIGQYLTIVLDGKVIESATIQSAIPGNGEISGIATQADAQNLAALLKSGPLPLTIAEVQATYVKPGTSPASPCATTTPAPTPTPGWVVSSGKVTPTPTPIPYDPNAPTPTPYIPGTTVPPTPAPDVCATPTLTPTPAPGIMGTANPTPAPGTDGSATPTDTPPPTPTPTAHP